MKTGTLFLNGEPDVTLTYYVHEASGEMPNAQTRPAILIFPGGGYRVCSDREAEPIAMAYMAIGYNAFVLRYSVGEKAVFPSPLRDAEKAMQIIIDCAGEWNVDTNKIAVIGFSAGGHLAASLGTLGRVKPSALILGYPCITEETCKGLSMPVPSLVDKVDETTPPTFIFSTWADELVPVSDSLAFANALCNAGIQCEIHIYQNGIHGLSLGKPHTSSGFAGLVDKNFAGWFELSENWLNSLWGNFDHSSEQVVSGAKDASEGYGIDVSLLHMWGNSQCKNLILSAIPILADEDTFKQAQVASLRMISTVAGDALSKDVLVELDKKLREIPVK